MVSSTDCSVKTYLKVLVKPFINFLIYIVENIRREMSFEMSNDIVLAAYLARCASVIAYTETCMNKVLTHTNLRTGYEWVWYILNGNKRKCCNVFRLSSHLFRELNNTLRTQYGYEGTKRVRLEESVAMTLVILGSGMCNRTVQDRFQRSGETVSLHVEMIVSLLAIVMAADIIKPDDPAFPNVPQHILNSDRYWPHFKVLC